MTNMPDDEQFVAFLRQFQPRNVGALGGLDRRPARWWPWSLAAASLVACVALAIRFVGEPRERHASGPPPPRAIVARGLNDRARVPAAVLAKQAIEWDATQLDDYLSDVSSHVLPRLDAPGSALTVLAKP